MCQATSGRRPNALVTPGPGIQLLPLTQNCSIVTEQQQDSQGDLFSSQEEEPEQKRRKTLQSAEVGDCLEGRVRGEHLVKKDVGGEENDYDRDFDFGTLLYFTLLCRTVEESSAYRDLYPYSPRLVPLSVTP